jgi:4-amino-4-deoxy-L-arabinose transferase-like glycosyltransferase
VHEHWERFFLKTHHREGAWYYFFVLLAPGILPWLGAPQALLPPPRRNPLPAQAAAADLGVFIFFFFSYSSSKLPGYILPIFPALALLMAAYLEPHRAAAASSRPACWW